MLNLTTSSHYTKGPFPWAVHLSLLENHAQCVSFSKIVSELGPQKVNVIYSEGLDHHIPHLAVHNLLLIVFCLILLH